MVVSKEKNSVIKTGRFICAAVLICGILILAWLRRGELSLQYLSLLASRALVLSIITLGAVFVFTVGAFGISLGASTLVGVVCGALTYNYTQSFYMTLTVCVAVPVFWCALSSVLSTFFELPAYVTAVLMLGLLGSLASEIISVCGGKIITQMPQNNSFSSLAPRFGVFLLFFAFCITMYEILPIGKRQKELGNDRHRAHLLGISRRIYSAVGFIFAGIGVGLGAFLILCSDTSIDRTSVSDLGFNIIFAIVLGGMPISGGRVSRLSSAVLGSASAIVVSEIMRQIIGGVEYFDGMSQALRAIILFILLMILKKAERRGGIKNAE